MDFLSLAKKYIYGDAVSDFKEETPQSGGETVARKRRSPSTEQAPGTASEFNSKLFSSAITKQNIQPSSNFQVTEERMEGADEAPTAPINSGAPKQAKDSARSSTISAREERWLAWRSRGMPASTSEDEEED